MDSTLSTEEFQRLQTQLLSLKTDNYSYAEDKRRDQVTIDALRQRVDTLEKQLSRQQTVNKINPLSLARNVANKLDNKLRSSSDSSGDHLIAENELLIRRIESQEEEFKITNQTLKEEIQSLSDQLRQFGGNTAPIDCDLGQSGDNTDQSVGTAGVGGDQMASNPLSFAILAEKEKLELRVYDLQEEVNNAYKEKQLMAKEVKELRASLADTDRLQRELSDSTDMIERQNSLIEEMRGHKQEMEAKNRSDCDRLRADHQLRGNELQERLKSADATNKALNDSVKELTDQLREMESIRAENEKLVNELVSYKDELSLCRTMADEKQEDLQRQHREQLNELIAKHDRQLDATRQECDAYETRIADLESEKSGLNQRILDDIEDRKIHEKKGVLMVKELKRQLHSERKRADKLQERLHELTNESTASISNDIQRKLNNNHNNNSNGNNGNDSSSVGSWSFMSAKDNANSTHNRSASIHSFGSDNCRESTTSPVSPGGGGSGMTTTVTDNGSGDNRNQSMLERENNELVARVTCLQQEKWTLEERINQLELSVSAMNDDIQRKTTVIEYYSMEGRPDPHRHHSSPQTSADKLTVKRVVDFIKDKGDENQKEINRKVQRMLEETLTKNMHLQLNLDHLSQEVQRLNQLLDANTSSEA